MPKREPRVRGERWARQRRRRPTDSAQARASSVGMGGRIGDGRWAWVGASVTVGGRVGIDGHVGCARAIVARARTVASRRRAPQPHEG